MEFLQNLDAYHWLSFSFLILIFEIVGVGGFMLGFSLAGLIVFFMMLGFDLSWQVQFTVFGILSVVFSVVWYLYQTKKDKEDEETTSLNKKENQLLGRKIVLSEDITGGKGRVNLGDTTWAAYADEDLKAGEKVEVTKVNGIFLHLDKVK
jgi:membrane protein implicated in regulation of membrane protease activity